MKLQTFLHLLAGILLPWSLAGATASKPPNILFIMSDDHAAHAVSEWELFDLQKDPREMHNVYADAAFASISNELKAELFRLKKELKDDDQFADGPPNSRPARQPEDSAQIPRRSLTKSRRNH